MFTMLFEDNAIVERYHNHDHAWRERPLADFIAAYNFMRRLETLNAPATHASICKCRISAPHRFMLDLIQHMPGLNT